MRVAIVAESFLPNVNGVTNSVLRVIEHLRRTGHEALVIAPDTPRGEPPADKVHDGIRVHRVPSRMFPKVTSLPLGVPRPRMVGVLRGFEPDVVHLASPALLGYGGLHAARYLGVPTVAVFQTDVAGFAESYGVGFAAAGGVGVDAAPALPCRPHAGTVDRGDGKPGRPSASRGCTSGRAASTSPVSRRRRVTTSLRRRWSPDGKPIVGFVGRLAPEKHVERLAVLAAATTFSWSSSATASTATSSKPLMPSAVFTGALYGEELAAAYASMDVFVHPGEHETFCQAVQEAMASGLPVDRARCGRAARPGRARSHRAAAAGRRVRGQAGRVRRPPDRRTAALLGGRAPQRAEPHLAGDLRRSCSATTRPCGRGRSRPRETQRADSALRELRHRLPLLPGLDPALVVGLGQLKRQLAEEHPQRRLRRRRRP